MTKQDEEVLEFRREGASTDAALRVLEGSGIGWVTDGSRGRCGMKGQGGRVENT